MGPPARVWREGLWIRTGWGSFFREILYSIKFQFEHKIFKTVSWIIAKWFYLTMPSTWITKVRKRTPKTNKSFSFMTAQITQSEIQNNVFENSNECSIYQILKSFEIPLCCLTFKNEYTLKSVPIHSLSKNHFFNISNIVISLQEQKETVKSFYQHWLQVKNQGRIGNRICECVFCCCVLMSFYFESELSSTIKSILESCEENEVLEDLKQFIKTREEEIEKICHNNYQVK